MGRIYRETFDDGNGGWLEAIGNGPRGARPLERMGGAVVSRSPWWIDYNHAPPGAGYLHLLFCLHTRPGPPICLEAGGPNRFIAGNFPVDFTNARLTARLCGEVDLRGAEVLFLMQGHVGNHTVGHLLTGQPFHVTPEWSEQTVHLTPDPAQWKCLGVRHDRGETYGYSTAAEVLRNLDVDIFLLLHPLDIVPLQPMENMHLLKAGEEYEVDRGRLPAGYVAMDEIRIEFAD